MPIAPYERIGTHPGLARSVRERGQAMVRTVANSWRAWVEHRGASRSAALAFYCLLSLAPMLVFVVTIVGTVIGPQSVQGDLVDEARAVIGPQGSSELQAILTSIRVAHHGIVTELVSGVVILISATSALAELKDSLDAFWEAPGARRRGGVFGLVHERLMALVILLLLAALVLISLAINTAVSSLGWLWGRYWEESTLAVAGGAASELFGFLIVTVLFGAIFKLLPQTPIGWREAMHGALLTATLFVAGKSAMGFLLAHGVIGSAYGAAGAIIVLLAWTYYSCGIFLFGALLTHGWAARGASGSAPTPELLP